MGLSVPTLYHWAFLVTGPNLKPSRGLNPNHLISINPGYQKGLLMKNKRHSYHSENSKGFRSSGPGTGTKTKYIFYYTTGRKGRAEHQRLHSSLAKTVMQTHSISLREMKLMSPESLEKHRGGDSLNNGPPKDVHVLISETLEPEDMGPHMVKGTLQR